MEPKAGKSQKKEKEKAANGKRKRFVLHIQTNKQTSKQTNKQTKNRKKGKIRKEENRLDM